MLIKNTYIRVLRGRSFQIRCQNYQKTTPNIDFSSFFQKKKKKKKNAIFTCLYEKFRIWNRKYQCYTKKPILGTIRLKKYIGAQILEEFDQ